MKSRKLRACALLLLAGSLLVTWWMLAQPLGREATAPPAGKRSPLHAIIANGDHLLPASGTPGEMRLKIVVAGGADRSTRDSVPLREGMRLYQAVMNSAGPSSSVNMKKVTLIRGTRQYWFDMRRLQADGSNNPVLKDGDTINIRAD